MNWSAALQNLAICLKFNLLAKKYIYHISRWSVEGNQSDGLSTTYNNNINVSTFKTGYCSIFHDRMSPNRPSLAVVRSDMDPYPCRTFLSVYVKWDLWLAVFALPERAHSLSYYSLCGVYYISLYYGVYDLGKSYAIPGLIALAADNIGYLIWPYTSPRLVLA